MRTMHLFAGVGGGLLADLILGHTPIIAVEWDRYACQVLRERAADGWFPELRVWEGDVRMFDPSEYAGKVDCIHAGFPCQDISVAGNQAGVGHETRSGLYREVLRIAGIVRPRFLFLENVSAILGNGLGTVLADLAAMGFSAEWGCLRASDCGAPHHRDRWWCLADSHRQLCGTSWSSEAQTWAATTADSTGQQPAFISNPQDIGCERSIEESSSRKFWDERKEISTTGVGLRNAGNDWWTVESRLGRVAHGVSNRVGQLKGYGNAQMPIQAAVAWKLLGGE